MSQMALQLNGLGRQKMAALVERARKLGMTPQRYLKHLVDEDLAISERAKSQSFVEILGSGKAVDESEVDQLVKTAKTHLYANGTKRK
jgi:hypothetical protein